jgi:hypothetical protein
MNGKFNEEAIRRFSQVIKDMKVSNEPDSLSKRELNDVSDALDAKVSEMTKGKL